MPSAPRSPRSSAIRARGGARPSTRTPPRASRRRCPGSTARPRGGRASPTPWRSRRGCGAAGRGPSSRASSCASHRPAPTGARSARATCTRTRAASAAGGRSKRRSQSRGPRRGGGTAPSPRAWPSGARGQTRGRGARASSQAVLFLGFVLGEAAHARVGPAAVRHGDREHDLVGARRVVEPHLHRVVVGAHERRVLEVQRDVDRRPGAPELLRRRDDRLATGDGRAERRAELRVEQRGGVLVLARLADDRGLPIGLGGSAERLGGLLREQRPELLPRVDERREVLDELPGERVLDDGDRRHLAHRALRRTPAVENPFAGKFVEDLTPLIDAGEELGALLAKKATEALGAPAESYGKAAIVGEAGEYEHAAALLHPKLGAPLRAAVAGGKAIIPSAKKLGGPGTTIDVPLHFKDAAFVRTHYDAMEVRLHDAPRANEIMLAIAVTDGGRPHPRVGGLTKDEANKEDGLR